MPEAPVLAPAYYATSAPGWRRDVWAVLHPPYTAWHLSYVLIGAGLAPVPKLQNLIATLIAFFLAVGISAHALDELRGRPLQTTVPAWVLWSAAVAGLALAVSLGLIGVSVLGPGLLPFIAAGVLFVFAYNLELLGGRLHGDFWFALSWGAFPVLTAYFAQTGRLSALTAPRPRSTRQPCCVLSRWRCAHFHGGSSCSGSGWSPRSCSEAGPLDGEHSVLAVDAR